MMIQILESAHLWRPGFSLANFSRMGPCVLWLAAAAAGFSQQPPQPALTAASPSDPFAMDLDISAKVLSLAQSGKR